MPEEAKTWGNTYSSSHMTLHHIEVVSLKSNLSVASVVSAKSFETGSRIR
jgi:hypothetical protein